MKITLGNEKITLKDLAANVCGELVGIDRSFCSVCTDSREADENTLTIHGTGLKGGTVDAVNDHRIAMAAAIAATACKKDVTILGAECVKKSYPQFWAEYARLGGNYEQYLR